MKKLWVDDIHGSSTNPVQSRQPPKASKRSSAKTIKSTEHGHMGSSWGFNSSSFYWGVPGTPWMVYGNSETPKLRKMMTGASPSQRAGNPPFKAIDVLLFHGFGHWPFQETDCSWRYLFLITAEIFSGIELQDMTKDMVRAVHPF